MEQQVNAVLPPHGSFGALLRECRHRAQLSQEKLAARAELSERTVRNLEADKVRSPRFDTVRLLADALQLKEPERESWFEAARDACGFGQKNRLPFTAELHAVIMGEFTAWVGPERARPFEQPAKTDAVPAGAFGRLLRRHRQQAGLTQKELGELSGVSLRAIWDLETGRTRRPRRSTVDVLRRALALDDRQARQLAAAVRCGHEFDILAMRDGVLRITIDKLNAAR